MNKAISDGVVLMPPAFDVGLTMWARGDGTPGSDTYAGTATAAFVPADLDFGGCLEIQKTDATQKIRYMGETPLLPGCYLRIRVKVKAMSGPLPSVRIAGWAGGAGGVHVSGLNEIGVGTSLSSYGEVVEVSAIVGPGQRTGVDMAWGSTPLYGHFGLDITGTNGAVLRIDDVVIEDITSAFLRDMINVVDVRDFGAVGDGVTDNRAAFEAANSFAAGRKVFVPKGQYFIDGSLTLSERVDFEGTLVMDDASILSLTKDFDLPKYIDAFGNEETGFRKAFQSLFNNSDHESLDMGGRRITITEPLDMQAIVGNKTSYAQRRVVRNGQFYVSGGSVWDDEVQTSQASYDTANDDYLTGVTNVANIPVGALVTGAGVGREIYVQEVNIEAQTLRLSGPLYDAAGTQTYTFTRFKYCLDFGGFANMSVFVLQDVEVLCRGYCSGIMLARQGVANHIKDCFINRPKNRGITSIGSGCQGLLIDRCQFISAEGGALTQDRKCIAINTHGNDIKLRDNRASQFRHFAVIAGQNSMITGNHFFQGDSAENGIRAAGIVLTRPSVNTTITGNYVDNCHIEWTNEGTAEPVNTGGFSFSGLAVDNNIFLCSDVAPWFSYMVVKPYGAGHTLRGFSMRGNQFRSTHGTIDRVERVDTTFATLNFGSVRDVDISGNTFLNVVQGVENPVTIEHEQTTEADKWNVNFADKLAFGGYTRRVTGLVHTDKIKTVANVNQFSTPWTLAERGSENNMVEVYWDKEVRGKIQITARIDS